MMSSGESQPQMAPMGDLDPLKLVILGVKGPLQRLEGVLA